MPVVKNTETIEDADAPLGDRLCLAFKSTVVTMGHGRGVVVGTGLNTEIGRIASAISGNGNQTTNLERLMNWMMFWLLVRAKLLILYILTPFL